MLCGVKYKLKHPPPHTHTVGAAHGRSSPFVFVLIYLMSRPRRSDKHTEQNIFGTQRSVEPMIEPDLAATDRKLPCMGLFLSTGSVCGCALPWQFL